MSNGISIGRILTVMLVFTLIWNYIAPVVEEKIDEYQERQDAIDMIHEIEKQAAKDAAQEANQTHQQVTPEQMHSPFIKKYDGMLPAPLEQHHKSSGAAGREAEERAQKAQEEIDRIQEEARKELETARDSAER